MLTTKVVRELQAFGAGRLSWVCDAGLTCAVSRSVQAGTTRESRPTLQPPMPSSTWPRREAFKHASRGFPRKLHSAADARVLESLQTIGLRPSRPDAVPSGVPCARSLRLTRCREPGNVVTSCKRRSCVYRPRVSAKSTPLTGWSSGPSVASGRVSKPLLEVFFPDFLSGEARLKQTHRS